MDAQEIKRRQQEGFRLRKELGDKEYRKVKAARRREYYDKMQETGREVLGEKFTPTTASAVGVLPDVSELKRPKKRGCFVQIMIVDETGEFTHTWEAPALMGTVIPGKRGQGYFEMAKPLLQQIYGKLV